jgi:hypothetical protein
VDEENTKPVRAPATKTLVLREFLDAKNTNLVEKLIELMPILEPGEQAQVYLGLMPYIYPKLKPIDSQKTPEDSELTKLSDSELLQKARTIVLERGKDYGVEKTTAPETTKGPTARSPVRSKASGTRKAPASKRNHRKR